MSFSRLSARIRPGLLNIPGTTSQSRLLAEKLLQDDRERHHCFFNKIGFHNHLSHHLLAAYDMGASARILLAIYDEDKTSQRKIDLGERDTTIGEIELEEVTTANWSTFLGQHKNYASLLSFFTAQVSEKGPSATLEEFIFGAEANKKDVNMLLRFVAGLFHPFIQTGYGAEFGSDAMVAQGIAQAAVSEVDVPELFETSDDDHANRSTDAAFPLLEIIRLVYDSPVLKPVMPYKPDALNRTRVQDALSEGRPEEIRRLAALWWPKTSSNISLDFTHKIQELAWLATFLLVGTSKPGRKPRLDFFLMHILTMTTFLPSILTLIPRDELKERLLRAILPVVLMTIEVRGRPRIDPVLCMGYTATPRPPVLAEAPLPKPNEAAIGDPRDGEWASLWPVILGSVVHAPDAHTLKAVRMLAYAAREYGTTTRGAVPGAYFSSGKRQGQETHLGIGEVDGSLFVRAAGVVMEVMGWVTHGQAAGWWDSSALGWDDAWKGE